MVKKLVAQPLLKPTKKVKKKGKPKLKPLSALTKQADKLLQEVGRMTYDSCEICGDTMSCLHHVYPKSTSTYLRYHWPNLVPICQSCHFQHHNGRPDAHMVVKARRGDDWWKQLVGEKARGEGFKPTRKFYENIIDTLNKMI